MCVTAGQVSTFCVNLAARLPRAADAANAFAGNFLSTGAARALADLLPLPAAGAARALSLSLSLSSRAVPGIEPVSAFMHVPAHAGS